MQATDQMIPFLHVTLQIIYIIYSWDRVHRVQCAPETIQSVSPFKQENTYSMFYNYTTVKGGGEVYYFSNSGKMNLHCPAAGKR